MSEWAYVWKPDPGLQWRALLDDGASKVVIDGATKQEVMDEMARLRLGRKPVEWKFEPPPQPKHRDDPKPAAPAIAGDSLAVVFHREILKAFHSDHHGHRSYTSDEIISTVNRLWTEATAK